MSLLSDGRHYPRKRFFNIEDFEEGQKGQKKVKKAGRRAATCGDKPRKKKEEDRKQDWSDPEPSP